MADALLSAVRRHAEAHADARGVAATPIAGLTVLRATARSELDYAISRPLVAFVLQGTKRVTMGSNTFDFGAGESLLIAADVPTVSQITGADARTPYLSLVLDLNLAVIAELAVEMNITQGHPGAAVRVDPTEAEVADSALRLMRLLARPAAAPILEKQLVRELHYWLLAGRHGPAMHHLGLAHASSQRVARAVAAIRADYAQPLRTEQLAQVAGMSVSSFHQHFRAVTSLSPLQFQKQLRLIEARRMMLADGTTASGAAYAVGYESVPQFTREYARLFGAPPARDMKAARVGAAVGASASR